MTTERTDKEAILLKQRIKAVKLAVVLGLDPTEIQENPYKVVRPAMDWLEKRQSLYDKATSPEAVKVTKLLNEIAFILH